MHPTRIFKSPEKLLEAWERYKKDLEKQAEEWLKVQYVGKDGERVADPQKVPYTLEGFKRFCRENYGEVQNYFDDKDGYYQEFYVVVSRIREEIRENQIVGGLLGFYNQNITARLNGLTEKVQNEIKTEQPLFGDE